jgi:hypothetical protein
MKQCHQSENLTNLSCRADSETQLYLCDTLSELPCLYAVEGTMVIRAAIVLILQLSPYTARGEV